jgi:RNA-directed DNA polymerase
MRPEPPTVTSKHEYRISTVAKLATTLGLDEAELVKHIELAPTSYSYFKQPKKSGGFREIRPPSKPLRAIQRSIYRLLECRVRYPRWMTGGVPSRSIFFHARRHVGRQMVATFDIKSFFPSVNGKHVQSVLERFAVTDAALEASIRLTTLDDKLPQGSPASCFLANLVLDPVDRQIDSLCRKHTLSFSRYVDDLAISGDCDLRQFRGAIISPIEKHGLSVAPDKVHFMGREVAQVVTNICVNDKLRPTKEFITDVKDDIWICLNDGGPQFLALEHGLSIAKVKAKLTGRVGHINQADPRLGKRLKGRLCGVVWHDPRSPSDKDMD